MGKYYQSTKFISNGKLIALSVISLLYLLTSICFASGIKTITVSKTDKGVKSIVQAVEMAVPGDTVLISEGLYQEDGPILIDKPLTLISLENAVIDGQFKGEIIQVFSDDVTIKGLTIQSSGSSNFEDIAALRVRKAKNIQILNNEFRNNFFAVLIQEGSQCTITDNVLYADQDAPKRQLANGIHCWKSNRIKILNNHVSGHRDGIYLEFVTDSEINKNISTNNSRYGLHFMFSHDNGYHYNTIRENGAGVAVMYSKRVSMTHNTFSDNWGNAAYAILLKDINDSEIYHNHFERNTVGVLAEGSTRIKMQYNHFKNNGWGLKIMGSCDNVQVNANNFLNNTFDLATNTSFLDNNFDGNYWDKYEGYDLDRDGVGDVPFRPVGLYSLLIERNPSILMLFRSFFVNLMDKAERILPGLTPVNLIDETPLMRSVKTEIEQL